MKKRTVLVILALIVAVSVSAFLYLNWQFLAGNSSSQIFLCGNDTDCISVCGTCENITYFHSHLVVPCANTLSNSTSARTCYCQDSKCINPSSIPQESQQQTQQQTPVSINSFYILMGAIIVVAFVAIGFFVSHLMKSSPETWALAVFSKEPDFPNNQRITFWHSLVLSS
jgi:Na+/H+ antiporter NhaD/arsenite permease-like protein